MQISDTEVLSNTDNKLVKPWFIWDRRPLSFMDRLRLLCGWHLYVRFDASDGNCHAACNLSHQITLKNYEQVTWFTDCYIERKNCMKRIVFLGLEVVLISLMACMIFIMGGKSKKLFYDPTVPAVKEAESLPPTNNIASGEVHVSVFDNSNKVIAVYYPKTGLVSYSPGVSDSMVVYRLIELIHERDVQIKDMKAFFDSQYKKQDEMLRQTFNIAVSLNKVFGFNMTPINIEPAQTPTSETSTVSKAKSGFFSKRSSSKKK